ncbi:MAG: site-specific integrase [Cloacibacterium sp.]|nr:site-specific integrase [Cloacibacterium sp.]
MKNIKITFVLAKSRLNQSGKCSIRCRITLEKKRYEFSTGLFTRPKEWFNSAQEVRPSNKDNDFINTQLSLIKQNINQAFLFLQVQETSFTAEDIYKKSKGEKLDKERTVLEMFDLHIARQTKLIGISTTVVSIAKFTQTRKHTETFIWSQFRKKDYPLKNLKMSFINEFEYYLKAEKKFKPHTVYKTIQRFRQMIKLAVGLDYLVKDPFLLYKTHKPKKEVVFLTTEELKELEEHQFASERLQQVADMFIFCCYTGLPYTEMANLKKSDIITGFDQQQWISITRQKTDRKYSIPLLSRAKDILDKYSENEELLPVVSNQRFNSYLKEIAQIVGIKKHLTHHLARKTFASTVLLFNDVPMEIVSELLGHSEISITQGHYAKVVQKKVSEQMINLAKKLK